MGIVRYGGGEEGAMKLGHDGNGEVVSRPSVPFSSLFLLFYLSFPPEEKKGGRPTGPPSLITF